MTNIIQFPVPEVVDVSYILDEDDTIRGLGSLGSPLELEVHGDDILCRGQYDSIHIFDDRQSAAKFFWACAYYLDSEQRYAEDTYVGLNYDKPDTL